tara:strand:+ start:41545 stop:41820 length:276 start_codon:yes stop_codon:yes gene_type:complete
MKKTILAIFAGMVGINVTALADVDQAKKLTPLQKQQIAWAIRILGSTKTLTANQNQCVQFDHDILSVLESEGRIDRGTTDPDTVCLGGGPY